MCTSRLNLSNGLPSALNGDRMQKLGSRVVDVSTNHLGVRKPCDSSSPRVRFLHVLGFQPLRLHVYDKKALRPPFVIILAWMSIATTSLLRDKAINILAALFYSLFYFIDLIEFGFTVSLYIEFYLYSFISFIYKSGSDTLPCLGNSGRLDQLKITDDHMVGKVLP